MRVLCGILLASASLYAQAVPPKLEFEVASIKPSAPLNGQQVAAGVHVDGAQVRCTVLSLKDYIRIAYRVKDYQISAPEWLASARFDISAKLPAGVGREKVPEMLQALLADRFGLQFHRDSKEFPVYALVVAKSGAKLKETPPDADGDPARPVNVTAGGGPGGLAMNLGRGSYFNFGNNRLEARKMTMATFAEMLARFEDRPVVDMTELKGEYDLAFDLSPEDYHAMLIRMALSGGMVFPPEVLRVLETSSGDSLAAALQTVGLKLDSRKAPLDVIAVDQMQKAPTEN